MVRAAGSRQRAPALVLPGVNSLIKISIGTSADPDGPVLVDEVPSRVEDLGSDQLIGPISWCELIWVALPRYSGDVDLPDVGTACRVSWPTPVGLYELPTAFDGRERVGPAVRAWRLRVTGPAVRLQRRRYVRVPWAGPVAIEVAPAGGEPAVPAELAIEHGPQPEPEPEPEHGSRSQPELQRLAGTMVDLSEGGLRCLLPRPGLAQGRAITAVIAVAGHLLRPPAHVVWSRTTSTPVGLFAETGISFDDPDEHGDLLRRALFEAQVQARRADLG